MTRQRKFRGISYATGKLEYVNLLGINEQLNWKERSIQDYIGMDDKHGVELYEGDKIRMIMPASRTVIEGKIVYNQNTCAYMIEEAEDIYLKNIMNVKNIEIIEQGGIPPVPDEPYEKQRDDKATEDDIKYDELKEKEQRRGMKEFKEAVKNIAIKKGGQHE